jgi:ribosome-associated protein
VEVVREGIIEAQKKALLAAQLAEDRKAEDIVILDMRKVTNFCDYFVICSAASERRAAAIAELIEESFGEKGFRLKSIQGKREGVWILLDFSDIVVHIFFKDVREYYALERLWADAKRVNVRNRRKKTAGALKGEH